MGVASDSADMTLVELAAEAILLGIEIPLTAHVGLAVALDIGEFVDEAFYDGGLRDGGQPPKRLTGPGPYHDAWDPNA